MRIQEWLEGGVGLTDTLIGRAKLPEVLQKWGRGQLYVLPSGRIPPNPSELPGSKAMALTLETLASRDETSAAVLCSDHTVFRTTDAGSTWGSSVAVPGSVALASSGNAYAIAVTGQPSCAGVEIATVDSGASPATAAGCAQVPTPAAGTVTVADGGGTLWLWAGDAFVRSDDAAATWY